MDGKVDAPICVICLGSEGRFVGRPKEQTCRCVWSVHKECWRMCMVEKVDKCFMCRCRFNVRRPPSQLILVVRTSTATGILLGGALFCAGAVMLLLVVGIAAVFKS